MSRLAYEDHADMLFSQIEHLLRKRIDNARRVMADPCIETVGYSEKIKALTEVWEDIEVLKRVWLG